MLELAPPSSSLAWRFFLARGDFGEAEAAAAAAASGGGVWPEALPPPEPASPSATGNVGILCGGTDNPDGCCVGHEGISGRESRSHISGGGG